MVDALCQRGVEHLTESEADELWLVADPSDLREPYATEMPDLVEVKDLDGQLVHRYREEYGPCPLALQPG